MDAARAAHEHMSVAASRRGRFADFEETDASIRVNSARERRREGKKVPPQGASQSASAACAPGSRNTRRSRLPLPSTRRCGPRSS